MFTFRQLPGLPNNGPLAQPFGAEEAGAWSGHSEGLVVEFLEEEAGVRWIGNFQPGSGQGWNGVVAHPDGKHIIVVANGQGYLVSPSTKRIESDSLIGVQQIIEAPLLNQVLVSDGTASTIISESSPSRRSPRIAWDEIRNLTIEGHVLRGQASGPSANEWKDFSLDLNSNILQGGSYGETMATAIRVIKD